MSVIQINELTFCYENSYNLLFDHVSFQLDTDWKLGFIGRNGRGKTTFLKLLMKQYAYSGSIHTSEDFAYFPFSVENPSDITFYILERLNPDMELWQISKELNQMGACPQDILYRPFCTLSQGKQTKVLLAALFLKENTFLLIDEPTNHLDARARQKVADYLSSKKGFILVSHDRAFLDACIDHVLVLNRQNIEVQKGNFSSWYANKQAADNLEAATNEKLKKDIKRLEDAAKRAEVWSDKKESSKFGASSSGSKPDRGFIGHKAAKMAQRSKSINNRRVSAAEEKAGLMKNIETSEKLKLSPLKFHNARLVALKDISIYYENRVVCSDINFTVEQGDRIALNGKNGSGKTSLLKLIRGENISYTGTLIKNPSLKISYVPQNFDFLEGSLDWYADRLDIDISLLKAILRKLDFSRTQFDKNIREYSDGQKKKVLLAGSLCEKAHLYIWDEPLNYIDVISRIQLEELISAYSPTLIFVEHDKAFVDSTATKTVNL